jgi:hypothetical protein
MAYLFVALTRCFAEPGADISIDRREVHLGRHVGNSDRKDIDGGLGVDVDGCVPVLCIARDDDSLRMVVLVVVADEDGDAMLVMVSMDGYFDIVRLTLFDWVGRQVEWAASSSASGASGDKGYLRCDLGDLGKYRSSDSVDKPDRREEGGKVGREMHVEEEEMGVRCTREEGGECYNGDLKGDDKERKMREE